VPDPVRRPRLRRWSKLRRGGSGIQGARKPRFLACSSDLRTLLELRAAFNAWQGYAEDARTRRVLRELLSKPAAGDLADRARRAPVGYVALCFASAWSGGARRLRRASM
jgi:hypothetical protein